MTGQKEIVLVPWALSAALDQALAAIQIHLHYRPHRLGKDHGGAPVFQRPALHLCQPVGMEDALDQGGGG